MQENQQKFFKDFSELFFYFLFLYIYIYVYK
jgi:hypothetical protein